MTELPPAIEALNRCFRAGQDACLDGKCLRSNPYRFDDPKHWSWEDGWWDMEADLADDDSLRGGGGW